jgi:hypothetical protein
VIETVALAKVALFESDTVRDGESVTADPPFVKESVAATEARVGRATRSSVVVADELDVVPSFTDQVMVRVWSKPPSVGLVLVEEKATLSRTAS